MTVRREPSLVITGPDNGRAMTDPPARASRTSPSSDGLRCSLSRTCGMRAAQLAMAKRRPMKAPWVARLARRTSAGAGDVSVTTVWGRCRRAGSLGRDDLLQRDRQLRVCAGCRVPTLGRPLVHHGEAGADRAEDRVARGELRILVHDEELAAVG